MLQKIVVPLDGSKLAECALPYAEEIARGNKANEIFLVSVTERVQGYRPIEDSSAQMGERLIPEAVGKMERQAQKYLDRIIKTLKASGIKAQGVVLLGSPAEEVINYVKDSQADLIVMSSHGRSGPSRWTHGSVAEKIFRASSAPVMVIKAPGCAIDILEKR